MNSSLLSVCIIAKNEEKLIGDCLRSVKDISDDIIVVDTGSSDSTKQIAEEYTSNIYDFEWVDDFSATRNFSMEKAKNPFILIIDCDERLMNPEIVPEFLERQPDINGGILVKMISYNDKRGSKELFESKLLRIVRNNRRLKFEGIIHEQIINSVLKAGYKLTDSDIKIYHEGYNFDPEKMKEKQNRNLKFLLKQVEENPDDSYSLFQTGRTYLALGDLDNAEKFIQRSIENAEEGKAVKPQALNYGGIIAYQRGNKQLAEERARKSLELVPEQGFANYILGECYFDKNNQAKALEYYGKLKKAYESEELKTMIVGDYKLPTSQMYFRLGRSNAMLGNTEEALGYFKKGLKHNENDINCLVAIADIENKRQNYAESLKYLEAAKKAKPNVKEIDNYIEQVKSRMKPKSEVETNSNEKPLISLSMIVKNEEKMLPGCLDSVKNIVDEIVIVDTGSTDNTVAIAEKYGAKIHHFKWIDDFAAARNEALKHTNGEWVMYLDADERLAPIDAANFREALKKVDDNAGGLICTIESPHAKLTGGDSDVHRGGYPRIFRNLGYPKVEFRGRVHEQISPSLKEQGLQLLKSQLVIKHLGYDQSREVMEEKIKRNYKMLLQHVKEEPTDGYAWYQLGQTLGHMNLKKEAEETMKFAIKCGNLSPMIEASAAASLAQFTGNDKRFAEALKWAERSLELVPESLYGMNLKAYALLHLGKNKEAEKEFEKTLELKKKFYDSTPNTGYDVDVPENIILEGLEKARGGG